MAYDNTGDMLLEAAFGQLQQDVSISLTQTARDRLHTHTKLVRRWNRTVGLVAPGDLEALETRHVMDALSLAPYIINHGGPAAAVLDIGSGGGFPGIVIKCVLPELRLTLVERSNKKSGFLHKLAAAIGAEDVRVIHACFPDIPPVATPDIITARAVERPQRLVPEILRWMPLRCVFLCQSEPILPESPDMFHVEHIDDVWRRSGWRRGELYKITRNQ